MASQLFSQGLYHPYNLDFEDGEKGKLPRGWAIPGYAVGAGYSAGLTDLQPNGGKLSFELRKEKVDQNEGIYGSVLQTLDAKPYRGKVVKFRAAVRAEISSSKGSAHLWLRERFEDGAGGLFEMMEDNPIVINNWKFYEITGRIGDEVSVINYGLLLKGSGKAWIDDCSFEVIEERAENYTPPKALSKKAIENFLAFARLYGVVRYFSPSNESQICDWDRFALAGVEAVENAESNDKLTEILKNLFVPLVPELEVFPISENKKKEFSQILPDNAMKSIALGWKHVGPPNVNDNKVFISKVENIYKSQREREGSVFQLMDAVPLQGKEIKFKASVRTYLIPPTGQAQLVMRMDKEEDKPVLTKTMDDNPISNKFWTDYSITAIVPANAKILRIGFMLIGEGSAAFDDAKLFSIENGKEIPIEVKNPGFEDSDIGVVARGWFFSPASQTAGYTGLVTGKEANSGAKCVTITSNPRDRVLFPELREAFSTTLNDDLMFRMPLNMFVDSLHTLPYPPKNIKPITSSKPEKFELTSKDRTSRLAIVTMLWNIYTHFNLFNDNEGIWEKALKEALTKASTDRDEKEFLATLQIMTSYLNDANARAWFGDEKLRYTLPFIWKWIEGNLIITEVFPGFKDIKPGDVVTEIEGKPAKDYIAKFEKKISASNDGWRKLRALAEIRAGKENSTLRIKVQSPDNTISEKEILRYVTLSQLTEKKPPEISTLNNSIYYIDFTRINDQILKSILDTLKNANGIIIDMRGLSLVSEHALGLFSGVPMKSIEWQIPIFTKPFQSVLSFKYLTSEIKAKKKLQNVKAIFLVDERTIGFGEGMVSIIKNYKLGEVVGRRTAGTCGEVAGFRMPGNFNFAWSIIRGMDMKEEVIYGSGIVPTVEVKPTIKGISEGRDEIFEKAVELLNVK